ncbi:synaptonemal complex protein 1 isoform X2 [Cimex lectularius]|uniref:Lebercilin domain-containing protein n=1 Tax=Cimex lectularius TaxID=79782 RepID=A0A8I6TDA4_CIMLE|nr:synaptonemal complex protein 1 isoform X2 [Cimex lectularius]
MVIAGYTIPNPYLRKLAPIGIEKKASEKHYDSIRIKELHNKLFEVKSQLEEAQKENVQLKTLQKRQEVEIKKLEDSKAEMPRMVKGYQEDHRIMTIKLKEFKQNNRELERRIKQKDEEIISLKLQNTHLVKLTKDRNLLEREKLMKKVQQLEAQVCSLEDANKKLSKKLELEEKRMNSILRLEITKHRETKNHLAQVLKSMEVLQGRNNINYITPQTKKTAPAKVLEENPSASSVNINKGRTKSRVKLERKTVSSTTLDVTVDAPVQSPKICLPSIVQQETRELTKEEPLELQPPVIEERVVKKIDNILPESNNRIQFPELECDTNHNGDIFSVDNLDWDEIKKYVHPRKDELIVKIENMFAKEQNDNVGICEFEYDEQVSGFLPSDLDKKDSMTNSSGFSQISNKQSSNDSVKEDIGKINSPSNHKDISLENRKSLTAILGIQNDPFSDQFSRDNSIGSESTTYSVNKKLTMPQELSTRDDNIGVPKDDNLFKTEQDFNQAKTKKNKNADILKYIFGKELLFEVNPE